MNKGSVRLILTKDLNTKKVSKLYHEVSTASKMSKNEK
jgi:hypothetical protein